MFKINKINSKIVLSTYIQLHGIEFIVFDLLIEKDSLDAIIPYFKKNDILFWEEKGNLKFRIAAINKNSVEAFNKIDKTLSNDEKIKIALEFDKVVTDSKLFGIGYEKSGMSEEGTKIRYLIRDELLHATKLHDYLTVNKDGWIIPRLCIYGVFTKNKIAE